MNKIKLISILTHEPQNVINQYTNPDEYRKRFPETEFIRLDSPPYWIGFFKNDFHHKWSRYLIQYSTEFEIECWRPYGYALDKPYEKKIEGITHKVFPSKKYRIRGLGELLVSHEMNLQLLKEAKRTRIIINFYGTHNNFVLWLMWKLRDQNIPIVLQHLGGSFGWFTFKYYKKITCLLPYLIEKKLIMRSALYLCASCYEMEFLNKEFPRLRKEYYLNGIDFNEFEIKNKAQAKKQLGFDEKSKIILYVGGNTRTKNVDLLLNAYEKIQVRNKNIKLLLIGGNSVDEFHQLAVNSGAIILERSDRPIDVYMNAADVYVMPIIDPIVMNFGGFGIAPIEALACGTPIVSNNLIHFPGTEEERDKLGLVFGEKDKLAETIEKVLSIKFEECRKVAKQYFNIIENTNKLIGFYKSILSKS